MGTVGGRRTHYELLGVSEAADLAELRAAYRSLAREAHPDSGGQAERMRRLNEAWYVLRDPGRRAAYDRELADDRRRRDTASGATPPVRDDATGAPEARGPHTPAGGVAYGEPGAGGQAAPPGSTGTGGESGQPVVEGWLAMLPPAALVATVALFGAAFMFASPALLVFSGGAALLTVGLFVLVPLRAYLRVSARASGDQADPPRPREE